MPKSQLPFVNKRDPWESQAHKNTQTVEATRLVSEWDDKTLRDQMDEAIDLILN